MKQAADLHTSTLAQMAAYRVLARPGFLEHHLERIRPIYRQRAACLAGALRELLGAATFSPPEGGMFIWARIDRPDVDTHRLLRAAVANGVAYVPGRAFGIDDRHPSGAARCRLPALRPTTSSRESVAWRVARLITGRR